MKLAMSVKITSGLLAYLKRNARILSRVVLLVVAAMFVTLAIGKVYQHWDDDPDRGAVAISNGAFGESYSTPVYLEQGWRRADSLWFYTTTQGSGLIPYDFFLALEQVGSTELFRANANMDRLRYLPQKPTFFNPDGLPVGLVKDTYQGKSYMGYTCAACHTGQVNYRGQAIRIDGGPAMANMVELLTELEKSMQATLDNADKRQRFIARVLELDGDYSSAQSIVDDLKKWTGTVRLYNTVNHSHVDYGYARLDAFGRIYNRVLQHVLNRDQLGRALAITTGPNGRRLLNSEQIQKVLEGVGETLLRDDQFAQIIRRLISTEPGYPGLSLRNVLRIRNQVFNEPNAPVSYPFLWDIAQSDYVQWNGLANNAGAGPLGRNTGEVIGVFGILDWEAQEPGFSLAAWISGQRKKEQQINFQSSINLTNLQRLESHLRLLQSPQWPGHILGEIDREKAARGQLIYAEYCQSCHEVIERNNWDRLVVAKMSAIDVVGTDPAMATNSVSYTGKAGNFKHIYQGTDAGTVIVEEQAPVVQILTASTRGVVATPDADKWLLRRWLDWLYTMGMSFFQNDIESSVKSGNYRADTTAQPYQSLLSYKARSLNGIWATAPYLHNGSVPSLYELLLPVRRDGDPEEGEYRPDEFTVGSREFDPLNVGFKSAGYDGFRYVTDLRGNHNSGHEYGAGRTPQADGRVLPALTEQQRWDLVEYLKTL